MFLQKNVFNPIIHKYMRTFKVILIILVGLILVGGGVGYWWYKSGGLTTWAVNRAGERFLGGTEGLPLLHEALGFKEAQTYLVLFMNNTEIRPGGGFLGTYAVLQVKDGHPQILKVEGTEILDNSAPKDFQVEPPKEMKELIKVKRWNFRDSNWYPDFALSAAKGLELYKMENGLSANEIDGVIGFTPTLIEDLLRITGPVIVEGEEFNAQNFLEKIEFEVEYGYAEKGVEFRDRKQMLSKLSYEVLRKGVREMYRKWPEYLSLMDKMIKEKQVVAYSLNPDLQKFILSKGLAGELKESPVDYLLWADANLGSLKTDLAVDRNLTYEIKPDGQGYLAKVTMHYDHNGVYDWRTTRYQTFARLYVPKGSKVLTVNGQSVEKGIKDPFFSTGEEKGRAWFGAFIVIEPGKEKDLTFEYLLPSAVVQKIVSGDYELLAQKQIGTPANELKLNLDFGRQVYSAQPGEDKEFFGDKKYTFTTDLREDRTFVVKTK